MPSRRPKTRRMDAAIAALTPLGFEKTQIRKTVNMLVKEYKHPESGWFFVEEDYYRLPIETMIKEQDEEQQRSKVVNEEQEVENEEEEGDGAFEEATERATERENSGREIVLFEAGSSSNMAHSGRGEYPADERALTNLADYCEMVQGIELSQVSPSSVPPEGTPSITWLSQEEEEEEEQQYFVVKRAPRSAPKRGASRGWISEEDEEDDD